jgi:flavin-dependent dehydrogenase
VNRTSRRVIVDEGVVLVGDAAGLALAPSGEGILTAIESGMMAAACILDAGGRYGRDSLAAYDAWIERRVGPRGTAGVFAHVPGWCTRVASRALFTSSWLTRRVLLEDGFLHMRRPPVERRRAAG